MKIYSLIFLMSASALCAQAQTIPGTDTVHKAGAGNTAPVIHNQQKITYVLPGGQIIGNDKVDSVDKSWGGGLMMRHSEDDDKKGIIHLLRMTDKMKEQFAEDVAKRKETLKAMINQPARSFSLKDINNRRYSLADLRGKVVVLNFWFTSCSPCIQEMPRLNELTQMYDPAKVVFLALTFNDAPTVKAFLQDHQFDYTVLTESRPVDKLYQISSWPTSIVIDKEGIIKMCTGFGSAIKPELAAAIDAAL